MMHSILRIVEIIAVLGIVSSSIYYLLCLWSAATFLREREAAEECPSHTGFAAYLDS